MKAGKKIDRRLQARIQDYHDTIQGHGRHESKVAQRIETGGFKRPGSRKKG